MKLKILLPTEVFLEEEITKVNAEAENGSFCLLPEHIDFVTALVPGILSFESPGGRETFIAVDEGILVKCGADVFVSTRQAIRSNSLETLERTVAQKFRDLNERERKTRSALAKLEVTFARRIFEIGG